MGITTTARCDSKGRIYLRERIRERYGETFFIVESPEGLLLKPKPKDPVQDLREMGKSLRGKSFRELKRMVAEQALEDASQ